jgi:hypothetical protein
MWVSQSLLKKNGGPVHRYLYITIKHNKDSFAVCSFCVSPWDTGTVKGVQSVGQQPCASPSCSCLAKKAEKFRPFLVCGLSGCQGECILHMRPRPDDARRGRESKIGPPCRMSRSTIGPARWPCRKSSPDLDLLSSKSDLLGQHGPKAVPIWDCSVPKRDCFQKTVQIWTCPF